MTSFASRGGQKMFFYLIGGFTVLALLGIFAFSYFEQKNSVQTKVASFSADQTDRPKAGVNEKYADLGNMSVNEEKSVQFSIENAGSQPLELFNVTSSCGCTVAKVTIDGKTSPEFGMHSKSNWTGEIPAGQNAKVDVIYRPFVMPVKGDVTREVYVSTNDPDNQLLTFTVKANVQ